MSSCRDRLAALTTLTPYHQPQPRPSQSASRQHKSADCQVPFTENNFTIDGATRFCNPTIFHSPQYFSTKKSLEPKICWEPKIYQNSKFVGSQNSFGTKVFEFYGDINNFKAFHASCL